MEVLDQEVTQDCLTLSHGAVLGFLLKRWEQGIDGDGPFCLPAR